MLDQVFSNLATAFSQQFGGPYIDAEATWPGTPTKDDGGSITAAGSSISVPCNVQFDTATLAMRETEGFLETDVRLLVLIGALDTRAKIVVASGEREGSWALLSCNRDPGGIGFECRGRRA